MIENRFFFFLLLLGFINQTAFGNVDSLQNKIDDFMAQAQFDSAKIYIQSHLNQTDPIPKEDQLNYQLVKILFIQSNYVEALETALKGLDKVKDLTLKSNYNFMIACIYSAIEDYDQSIKYFDKVLKESKDESTLVKVHLLTSELYLELKDSVRSKKALTNAFAITNHSDIAASVKHHVAMQYHFFHQNYETCKKESLKIISDSTSFVSAKNYAYSLLGDCFTRQDSMQKAIKYYDKSLALTFQTKDPEQVKVISKKLIEAFEKIGDQEKANTYHKIYNDAQHDAISFTVEKYKTIHAITQQRDDNNAKKTRSYWPLGIGFLFILSLGSYFYFSRKDHSTVVEAMPEKVMAKKIVISEMETERIKTAIDQLISDQLFLRPRITRKSFCLDYEIKSERYLSHYINTEHKKSFSIFINDLRVEYAYQRLQSDPQFRQYKVEEIAKESGFGSKKSFERAFLAKYQETPHKFILSVNN